MVEENVLKKPGLKYLLLALGAFAGLGLEFLAIGIGYLAFGRIPSFDGPHWQIILHWILTCIIWGFSAALLIRTAKDKLRFDIFAAGKKMQVWQWIAIFSAIALSVAVSYVSWDMNFKVIREFKSNGPPRFIFQYIYYIFETALFLLIIVFGQRAFEVWTKKPNIPWGGILCSLTWGIAHIISRGYFDPINGILSAVTGFMFGAVYLFVNRDIKKSWVIMFFMFVL